MAWSATQNPSNKVGRNSGAGPNGISRVAPTEAEARRGLTSIELDDARGWTGALAVLGTAVAVLGAGVAAYAVQQRRRRNRGFRANLERLVSWR